MRAVLLILGTVAALISGCGRPGEVSAPRAAAVNSASAATVAATYPGLGNSLDEAIKIQGLPKLISLAEAGDTQAQLLVAIAYGNGAPGLVRNEEIAYRWLLRAANQGDPRAQFRLAGYWFESVREGANVLQTNTKLTRVLAWLFVAESTGHPPARAKLNELEQLYMRDARGVAGFREDVWRPAQQLAAQWRQCTEPACWTRDFAPRRPAECERDPSSLDCILAE